MDRESDRTASRTRTRLLLVWIVVGAIAGALISEAWLLPLIIGETRWLGLIVGGVIGWLAAIVIDQDQRLRHLEQSLLDDRDPLPAPPESPVEPQQSSATTPSRAAPESAPATSPSAVTPATAAAAPTARPTPAATWAGWARIGQWFQTGNIPVKVGALVSLIGVAALLRYATEQGWLTVPIEWRLSAIAVLACLALVFAWRQRVRRRAFALAVQGLAIGVLVLTVFAASRLYALLPPAIAMALTAVLVFGGGLLAVVQRALALAVVAMIAGFAAPFLVGQTPGDPIGLFTWYAILNLAVFGIAWIRAWPLLNRIGFGFTFVLTTLWGILAWTPSFYATAQAFLILYALLYLLIPILQMRRNPELRLDAVLVFGLPLVAFPLQIALLGDNRLAIAAAALIVAAVYLISALVLVRAWQLPTLGRAHAVLALGFATLAVPFAFSGPTLTVIWALEGAALVWFGCLQRHRLSRWAGLLLQIGAAGVWLIELALASGRAGPALANPITLGGLSLAAAGLISAWRYDHAGAGAWRVNLLAGGSLGFWILAASSEIERQLAPDLATSAHVAFWGLTGLLGALVHRWRAWAVAGATSVAGPAVCALLVFAQLEAGAVLTGASLAAWSAVLLTVLGTDHLLGGRGARWRAGSILTGHAALLSALGTAAWVWTGERLQLETGWQWLAGAAPLLGLTGWLLAGGRPPLARVGGLAEPTMNLTIATLLAVILGLFISLAASGGSAPLPWLPLLNPLELGQLLALALILLAGRRQTPALPAFLPAALGLALASAMALRAVHHLAGVDWNLAELLDSNVGQASLSIVWTALGVLAWIAGSRRAWPALWWAGAVLLGIVLAKLIVIDRQFLSTVAGILSFLAFGLLSIVVGYLAPAPPRPRSGSEESS